MFFFSCLVTFKSLGTIGFHSTGSGWNSIPLWNSRRVICFRKCDQSLHRHSGEQLTGATFHFLSRDGSHTVTTVQNVSPAAVCAAGASMISLSGNDLNLKRFINNTRCGRCTAA